MILVSNCSLSKKRYIMISDDIDQSCYWLWFQCNNTSRQKALDDFGHKMQIWKNQFSMDARSSGNSLVICAFELQHLVMYAMFNIHSVLAICISLNPILCILVKLLTIILVLIRNICLYRIIWLWFQEQIPCQCQDCWNTIWWLPGIWPQHPNAHGSLVVIQDIWVIDLCHEAQSRRFEWVVSR